MKKHITYCEDGKFYGIIILEKWFEYHIGPFKSRSTARRAAKARQFKLDSEYKRELK